MTKSRRLLREPEKDQMDRRMIRVEIPMAQAGIAAALRRAFQTAPAEIDERECGFAALLAELN
jgi:hypothetical protein